MPHSMREDWGDVKRIDVESALNESRNWLLALYGDLTEEQLRRPLTPSEHDPHRSWSALDHFSHLAHIEVTFAQMIRRHLAGHTNPVGLLADDEGATRTREQIFAIVHATNDRFQRDHGDDSFSEIVALTAQARGETIHLLSELSDEQLAEHVEGAPWGDGTIAGVLATNADHARMHWKWVTEAGLLVGGGSTVE
jgi:hypothetical protein